MQNDTELQKIWVVYQIYFGQSYLNKKFTYIIESDASEKSYGGILKYRYDGNTIEHHCRYYSGTFNNTEIKWEINRKELYSVYKCLLSFEPYIVYNKFIIRTDNTQVKWWLTRKIPILFLK